MALVNKDIKSYTQAETIEGTNGEFAKKSIENQKRINEADGKEMDNLKKNVLKPVNKN